MINKILHIKILWHVAKAVHTKKVVVLDAYIIKHERLKVSDISIHIES